ncbi:DnaJ-class molecular chaperone [Pseudarthrobacter sp. W1I19]|uniref:J domain-containing protein n=1 Tax=Pseudarthrobacter sp. W1I19 TaxID=3042288 RepID=UPI00278327CB|nr:J domain-containing protein [Pseudarthrobacter sp. W1I19]MDQ0922002.1 DnaJ-class molecular chaperone [Pseudarthrobacter sp. W1I19]
MSNIPDYYATLRVPRDATQQQISRAYRALMRSHHPDLDAGRANPGSQQGSPVKIPQQPEGELLRIMQAFAVLRDPSRRADYDREVKAVPAARATPASGTARDIPVRKVQPRSRPSGNTIRISPVHWESGPWA